MRTSRAQHLRAVETPADKSKYEILFQYASDAILVVSNDGLIDDVNLALEELTGYLKNELLGRPAQTLAPDPEKLRGHHRWRPLAPELFQTPGTYEDVALGKKDGYIRHVDLSVRHVSGHGNSPPLVIVLLRDITEKKNMERELITKHAELRNAYFQLERKSAETQNMQETLVQAGKMAALGELAAGIAHELNQPLQGIRGYTQEIQAVLPPNTPETGTFLKEIISNVDKMAAIINYLRTFTRKSTEGHENTDIHHAIEEALKMLSRQFSARGITVERRFSLDLPRVFANPLQLEQVFINLSTNARDAIEATGRGSGRITIETRRNGSFVETIYRDDGIGMTEKTKTKIFNPFFTTKEVGKGMGLGLSLSYGILEKLHGSLFVESEFGKGTSFVVRIPIDFRELG